MFSTYTWRPGWLLWLLLVLLLLCSEPAIAQPSSAVCNGVAVPAYPTANRPSSPNDQTAGFNSSTGYCEIYSLAAGAWQPMLLGTVSSPAYVNANGTTPSIAAGTGAGTSPTLVSVLGNQNGQVVSITTGTSPAASASVAVVTLGLSCPTRASASLTPVNAPAALLSGAAALYVTQLINGYQLNVGSTALTASTAYKWAVHVDCF